MLSHSDLLSSCLRRSASVMEETRATGIANFIRNARLRSLLLNRSKPAAALIGDSSESN
jgi:hypothetical protein